MLFYKSTVVVEFCSKNDGPVYMGCNWDICNVYMALRRTRTKKIRGRGAILLDIARRSAIYIIYIPLYSKPLVKIN